MRVRSVCVYKYAWYIALGVVGSTCCCPFSLVGATLKVVFPLDTNCEQATLKDP